MNIAQPRPQPNLEVNRPGYLLWLGLPRRREEREGNAKKILSRREDLTGLQCRSETNYDQRGVRSPWTEKSLDEINANPRLSVFDPEAQTRRASICGSLEFSGLAQASVSFTELLDG
jgi:hypothetical protein